MRKGMVVGAGVNALALLALVAVSFFLTPYMIRSLGKPRYDVWCVVESVLAYFTLLDLGIAAGVVRVVARGRAKQDLASISEYTSAALVLYTLAGLIVLIIGTPILLAFAPRLQANAPDVIPFMLLMLLNLSFSLPLSLFPAMLEGLEAFATKGAIRIGLLAVRTTAILAYLHGDAGLWPLAVIITVTNLLEHLVLAAWAMWLLPGLRLRPWAVERATLRSVRSESLDAFLAMLAGRMTLQTGAIIIGLLLPAGSATFFATAVRLVENAKQLLRQITTTLTPGISAMHAHNDTAGIRKLYLAATKWVLYFAVPVNAGLFLFGDLFLTRWVGADFAESSGPAVQILALTLAIGMMQSVASRVLYGLGDLWWFARMALVEGVVNIALTAALIQPFGVNGVAWAVALPNLGFCVFVIVHSMRKLGITTRAYLRAVVPSLGFLPLSLLVWMLLPTTPDWLTLITHGLAGLVPYALAIILWESQPQSKLAKILRRSMGILPMRVDPADLPTHSQDGRASG
ncbi:MAG: oligosaccharide flippase family protein [Fimbriiglobus sp.]